MHVDVDKIWAAATSAVMGGVVWLIRRVITNERQIALLEQSLRSRDDDIKEIKQDIKHLLERRNKD